MRKKLVSRLGAVALAMLTSVLVLLSTQTPASAGTDTIYWGCPSGVACVHTGTSGGGSDMTISVGQYGGGCHDFSGIFVDSISSASADFGSGYDLVLYQNFDCNPFPPNFTVDSSEAVNFTGFYAWFNDQARSFRIECC